MNQPYSVIIPTRGRPQRLAVALEGVFAQTVAPTHVFVIVDEPEDVAGKYEFLKTYGNTLEVIHTGGSAGAARARNLGLKRAPHGFVFFLDDDDEWFPGKCAVQMELLERRRELVGVTCGREIVYPDGSRRRIIPDEAVIARYLNCLNYTGSFSFFGFRKDRVTEGIFLDECLKALQDYEFYMRLGRCGGIGVVDGVFGIYHDHGDPRISTSTAVKADALRAILSSHWRMLHWSDRNYQRARIAELEILASTSSRQRLGWFVRTCFWRLSAAKIISLPRCLLPKQYSRR